jgi:predicted nuclease of predicted toxin-antitoxin system
MALPAYADVYVPFPLVAALRGRSMDVTTAQEDGTDQWDDDRLLERSTALGRVFLTNDTDFWEIAARWQKVGREFPGILYVRLDADAAMSRFVDDIELILETEEPEKLAHRILVVPL